MGIDCPHNILQLFRECSPQDFGNRVICFSSATRALMWIYSAMLSIYGPAMKTCTKYTVEESVVSEYNKNTGRQAIGQLSYTCF